jgi:transcriptional regulator GlxA family with amidase domain
MGLARAMDTPNPDARVPRGPAFCALAKPGPTRTYAFILVPGFTFLAFASSIEPLRIANQISQRPLYRWIVLSETGQPVESSSGIAIGADAGLDRLDRTARLFVCGGNPQMAAANPAIVAAVQRHHRFGGHVGGICTGAVALARAGLLAGRRFTLHWENQPGFVEAFADLAPTSHRFEIDDRVLTCGGGAAATDMMVFILAQDHGRAFANAVSEMCLRADRPAPDTHQRGPVTAMMQARTPALVATIRLMRQNIETPLAMDELSQAVGYSRRHLERLFRVAFGRSPGAFYRDLRLDFGRSLLATTDMTLREVSIASGFSTVSHFSKSFRARYHDSPRNLVQP